METENIYIFLFNGFSDWEISYLTPELKKSKKISLKFFSIDGLEITSVGGLKIIPDLSIKQLDIDNISILVLPGGSAWEEKSIKGIDKLVETLYAKNKTIAAICAATTFLGQKGYLDNVKHTSNALDYLKYIAPEYKGETKYQSEFSLTDKNIITANGTAPIEFAREIFKKIKLHNRVDIEKWFQLFKNGIWTN
ncbi:MAG: type 1 glutamine amidotransferase family protein [Melioribacteraceae bacterium]